jgi:GT2 family glycosyltransferase
VAAVIVNWNAGEALLDCVKSLRAASSTPVDVVVVDNASKDDSVARLAAADPEARIIRNRHNAGLPAANNQGLVATDAPYVLISNPDIVYRSGAVDAFVAAAERHPKAAFVIPRLTYEDGTTQTSVGDLPTFGEALRGRQAQRRAPGSDAGFWWDGWGHDVERQVGRGHEAAYLVRREAIAAVGVQDERFFLDWEGIDWTARMRDAGWEVWFTPEAVAVHLGGVSIRQVPFRWIIRSHRGIYRYYAKRHPSWRPWLAPVLAGRAATKLALAAASDVYQRGHRA